MIAMSTLLGISTSKVVIVVSLQSRDCYFFCKTVDLEEETSFCMSGIKPRDVLTLFGGRIIQYIGMISWPQLTAILPAHWSASL